MLPHAAVRHTRAQALPADLASSSFRSGDACHAGAVAGANACESGAAPSHSPSLRNSWRFRESLRWKFLAGRGRDTNCLAPPGQIRTCADHRMRLLSKPGFPFLASWPPSIVHPTISVGAVVLALVWT